MRVLDIKPHFKATAVAGDVGARGCGVVWSTCTKGWISGDEDKLLCLWDIFCFRGCRRKEGLGLSRAGNPALGFQRVLSNDWCRFLMEDSFIWVPVGEPGFPSLKI